MKLSRALNHGNFIAMSFRALTLVAIAFGFLRCSSSARGPGAVPESSTAGKDTVVTAAVQTGLDRLIAENFAPLQGKSVGLITNQTGRTGSGEFGPHVFANQKAFKLIALFGP